MVSTARSDHHRAKTARTSLTLLPENQPVNSCAKFASFPKLARPTPQKPQSERSETTGAKRRSPEANHRRWPEGRSEASQTPVPKSTPSQNSHHINMFQPTQSENCNNLPHRRRPKMTTTPPLRNNCRNPRPRHPGPRRQCTAPYVNP
jgi:hypothetical protein